ncbi:hypothetical protein WICMUC_004434 [Wickerhamomyces mucosus]|uniref:Anaphase-promoting complex subunit 4 WD40 domain-containing protein n=1 Tax=Wickerhamomyces mucosus TaxID=1378264 RepID=A0A9P8PH71_9ASCO|nr:hypothetical protein WICMUC_004434 [Wickerhamomyces mucosus]
MNISLLDPFAALKEFPETLTHTLSLGYSVCVKYSNQGNYLASGLSSGAIVIIDNDTKSVIRQLNGHTRPIQSLCWSKCGRFLLSSSRDWKTLVWDLDKNEIIKTFKFDGPIWHSEFNPLDHNEIVVSLYDELPVFIDSNNNLHQLQNEKVLVVKYHANGKLIFTGTNKGVISIIKREGLEKVFEQKFTNSSIKNIVISKDGLKLAINSSDRILRQIKLPKFQDIVDPGLWELEIEHKYQDIVNRIQWNSIAFNDNSEYLIASAYGSAHVIYMWETSMGSLVKILEGPKEELVDIEWNTTKCIICATGVDSGIVYIWSLVVPQKWSSLAPDFVEIEENIDYEEKEDEFDIVPADELNLKQLNEEADEFIDVMTKEDKDARGNPLDSGFIVPIDYNFDPSYIT